MGDSLSKNSENGRGQINEDGDSALVSKNKYNRAYITPNIAGISLKDYIQYNMNYYILDILPDALVTINTENNDFAVLFDGDLAFEHYFNKNWLFQESTLNMVITKILSEGQIISDKELQSINNFHFSNISATYVIDDSKTTEKKIIEMIYDKVFVWENVGRFNNMIIPFYNCLLLRIDKFLENTPYYEGDKIINFYDRYKVDKISNLDDVLVIATRKTKDNGNITYLGLNFGEMIVSLVEITHTGESLPNELQLMRDVGRVLPPIQPFKHTLNSEKKSAAGPDHSKAIKSLARITSAEMAIASGNLFSDMKETVYPRTLGLNWNDLPFYTTVNIDAHMHAFMEAYKGGLFRLINKTFLLYSITRNLDDLIYENEYGLIYDLAMSNKNIEVKKGFSGIRLATFNTFYNISIHEYRVGDKLILPTFFSSTVEDYRAILKSFLKYQSDQIVYEIIVPSEFMYCTLRGTDYEAEMIILPGAELEIKEIMFKLVDMPEGRKIQKQVVVVEVVGFIDIRADYKVEQLYSHDFYETSHVEVLRQDIQSTKGNIFVRGGDKINSELLKHMEVRMGKMYELPLPVIIELYGINTNLQNNYIEIYLTGLGKIYRFPEDSFQYFPIEFQNILSSRGKFVKGVKKTSVNYIEGVVPLGLGTSVSVFGGKYINFSIVIVFLIILLIFYMFCVENNFWFEKWFNCVNF